MLSCGYPLIGQGYARLVDNHCAPIKDKDVHVNSIKSPGYLGGGHLTRDNYTTDSDGSFTFDIEKSANKMIFFLEDEITPKKPIWNWYSATSNKDVILYLFNKSSGYKEHDFKKSLLNTSQDSPLNIVYPYEKGKCTNHEEMQKYNLQKREADRRVEEEAKEKARIDAIVEVIPTFTVVAYGVIETELFKDGKNWMTQAIPSISNTVPKAHQKNYGSFGMFIDVSQPAVLKHPDDLTLTYIYPDPGLTDPRTGITQKSLTINYDEMIGYQSDNKPFRFVMSVVFNKPWKIVKGEWVMRIKYKEKVLIEQKFIVE